MALRFSDALAESDGADTTPGSGSDLSTADLQVHIARELHDQVASPLIALVIELHELRIEERADADTSQRLAVLEESARQVLRQAREILINLRGQAELRLNFARVLESDVLARLHSRAVITLDVSPAWPESINGWSAFNLARIVHEAATNAVRHGRARSIAIALNMNAAGEAIVSIEDDGSGFDGVTGLGVTGMRERAVILGGTFSSGKRAGGGTRVEVRVPKYRVE